MSRSASAKGLLVLLTFIWGLSWPTMRIALDEVDLWTLRVIGFSISTMFLLACIKMQRRSMLIPTNVWGHVFVASLLNIFGFSVFASLAQLTTTTTRAVILNYSMPIWGSLMAWLFLGERLNANSRLGLGLCAAGIAILVYPVAMNESAIGLLLALGCALCWAGGTIYMKWARIPGDIQAITMWQIGIGAALMALCYLLSRDWSASVALMPSVPTILAIAYNGLFATGIAYLLWFMIIDRLPIAIASLGSLASPVIGIVFSTVLLDEHPTVPDIVGFGFIFAAAVCVLIPRGFWRWKEVRKADIAGKPDLLLRQQGAPNDKVGPG